MIKIHNFFENLMMKIIWTKSDEGRFVNFACAGVCSVTVPRIVGYIS